MSYRNAWLEPYVLEVLSTLSCPYFRVKMIRRIILKRYGIEVNAHSIEAVLRVLKRQGIVVFVDRHKHGTLWKLCPQRAYEYRAKRQADNHYERVDQRKFPKLERPVLPE